MLPKDLKEKLEKHIAEIDHPRELAVDVMFALQDHYGYLSDEAVEETARMLDMTPLEVEELATFYTFTYREPVGKYVIHVCDSVICWMDGYESLKDYLCKTLGINLGETTADGLFTLLPVCCKTLASRPLVLAERSRRSWRSWRALESVMRPHASRCGNLGSRSAK